MLGSLGLPELLVILVILYNVRTRALHRHAVYLEMWEWLWWTGLITFSLIIIESLFVFDYFLVLIEDITERKEAEEREPFRICGALADLLLEPREQSGVRRAVHARGERSAARAADRRPRFDRRDGLPAVGVERG